MYVAVVPNRGSPPATLFDQRDLAEITSPDYPGERLVVCRNPRLAEERTRKREALLVATEQELDRIAQATARPQRPLRGLEQIALRVGRVVHRCKVGKPFRWAITDETFTYERDQARIAQEAALDGIYVIRTTVPAAALDADEVVRAYKRLSAVEHAFRILKSLDLLIRPIYHRLEERVRGHALLCLLASYVEWHMRHRLAPLATLTKNQVRALAAGAVTVEMLATPTPVQQCAFDPLQVSRL